jgi:hypothetical protein
MSLREDLAQQLHEVYWAEVKILAGLDPAARRVKDDVTLKAYLAQADECIRQMEWVRSCSMDEVGGPAEDTHDRISDLKLTAAPEDWRP